MLRVVTDVHANLDSLAAFFFFLEKNLQSGKIHLQYSSQGTG